MGHPCSSSVAKVLSEACPCDMTVGFKFALDAISKPEMN
jgi:hypothetical protein